MPELTVYAFVFAYGAAIGSFLNVCVYRIPAGLSIVSPPSSCVSCKSKIAFYDNIPILSYIILRGRCRNCGIKISIEYPAVELLTALFTVALYYKFSLTAEFFAYFLLVSALIAITFIDIRHKIIPNIISLPGIVVGFLVVAALSYYRGGLDLLAHSLIDSLLGFLIGGGVLLAIATLYHGLTGRDGMGGGDIKLLSMLGAWLGWKGVLVTLFGGSLVGSVIGVIMMIFLGKDSKYALPFGPYLALGAIVHIFFGEAMIGWYIDRFWVI